jgi:hypothetical protein
MIRDFEPKDLDSLNLIHKSQGFDYALPEFSSPLLLVKKVREENGRVVGAMFLRLTAEAYFLCEGSPVSKARSIEELQPEVDREAFLKGLDEYVCVIPPEIAENFAPVLERRGFEKLRDWPLWQRSLDEIGSQ